MGRGKNIKKCGSTAYIWTDLIKQHANLQIVLSGHQHTDDGEAYRIDRNNAGNRVHQMLANYQEYAKGGNGWLRILEFDNTHTQVKVRTYSPHLDRYDEDPTGHFSFTLDWANSAPATIPTPLSPTAAFTDDGRPTWSNWSWGTNVSMGRSSPVFAGNRSMSVTYNRAWAGVSLHHAGSGMSAYFPILAP
jgi:hypothetical protein